MVVTIWELGSLSSSRQRRAVVAVLEDLEESREYRNYKIVLAIYCRGSPPSGIRRRESSSSGKIQRVSRE